MAIEYAVLDLYHLLVEVVFGNFLLAIMGTAIIFAVMCFMFKTSLQVTIITIVIFLTTMFVGFYGSLIGILSWAIAGMYFGISLVRWLQGMQTS